MTREAWNTEATEALLPRADYDFPGPLLCSDALKRLFYECVGIKTYVNITCENLFFELEVDFFSDFK